MRRTRAKIVAIDPGTEYMGVAAFEGTELVDFAVKRIRQNTQASMLDHVEEIIERLVTERRPKALIYEKNQFSQIKGNIRLVRAISRIELQCRKHRVQIYAFDPRSIRKIVTGQGNISKAELAKSVANKYRETTLYLRGRNDSQTKKFLNAFDAIACGLAYLQTPEKMRSKYVTRPTNMKKLEP